MKKNIYGNIEDLVIRIRMVTPLGTVERNFLVSTVWEGGRVVGEKELGS